MGGINSVHKFKSRREWEEHAWEKIVEGLAMAKSSRGIKDSLDLLLTASEKKQMINRATAIFMLKQGKTYREIGEMLWLSPATISAIKKSMKQGQRYISEYDWNKISKKFKKPAKFLALSSSRHGRRIPPGTQRMTMPHGKLLHPQKMR